MRKGDYKEWKADFDPFKSDWNKVETSSPAPSGSSNASSIDDSRNAIFWEYGNMINMVVNNILKYHTLEIIGSNL